MHGYSPYLLLRVMVAVCACFATHVRCGAAVSVWAATRREGVPLLIPLKVTTPAFSYIFNIFASFAPGVAARCLTLFTG